MRAAARLVAVLGAVGVAYVLLSGGPKDVVLVYDVSGAPDATALEVEVRRGDDLVRRAEFRLAGRGDCRVRHELRLPAGDYALVWRTAAPGGGRGGEQPLVVAEDGTIVLALGR